MKGIIFDLDGVIVHTDKFHYLAWKSVADELGVYFDENINNRLRGVSRMESLNIILEKYDGELSNNQKNEIATRKNERYKALLKNMNSSDVNNEVIQTLKKLKDKGIKLAIGSSSKNAKYILERTELTSFFDAVSDGNNITKSKPDPEVFLKAADFINLKPDDCIVVEDAIAGIDAAYSGGFKSAAIGKAQQSEKATYKLNSFCDLLKI